MGSGVLRFNFRKIAYATSKNCLSAFCYLIYAFPRLGYGFSHVEVCKSKGL